MSQAIFKNPFVSVAPVVSGVGNGTLTIDKLTHFTINQSYTVICTAVAPFTVFNVIGSLDGPVGVAVVGTQFYDEDLKVFFTIQQGPTLFVIGDQFTFTVAQGTDVTAENIDTYDELPQKNFSPGTAGTNSGNDNLRFTQTALFAGLTIQDLTFTSLLAAELGNFIQIEYVEALLDINSSLVVQDLTYTADAVGPGGDAITIEYEDFTPATFAVAAIGGANGVGYTADVAGAAGNSISIEYTDGAPTSTPVVSVLVNAITVQIQNGITTAQEIHDEVNGFPAAAALVNAQVLGIGSTPQVAPFGPVFLSTGADAIGEAGDEVVTVTVNAIKVKLQSGVSTATQVKAAVDGFPAAAALVNVTISGVGSDPQTAPFGPTNLAGGQNGTFPPGSEDVQVVGTKIIVTFQSGFSTATQIKAAIDGEPAAAALVSTAISGAAGDFQTAPAKDFLSGGSPTDNYAFNVNEISSPLTFYEGSGNLILNKLFVQGVAQFRKNVSVRALLELNDFDAAANLSGAAISNPQQYLNYLVQNGKIFFHSDTFQPIAWSAPNLTFTEDLKIKIQDEPFVNTILQSNSPIAIADGQSVYVILNRHANVNVTPVVATTLPKNVNLFRIATRIGTKLIWWDGSIQNNGTSIVIGEGSGSDLTIKWEGTTVQIETTEIDFVGSVKVISTGANKVEVKVLAGVGISSDHGDLIVQLRPETSLFKLQSPDLTIWEITVSDAGILSATDGASGPLTNIKVTKPDTSEASFAITNLGELQVVSPPAGGEVLRDDFYLQSPDGTAWKLNVTNLNEIEVESDTTLNNKFEITNDQDDILFSVQETNGVGALVYAFVYTSSTLPASPPVKAGVLPFCFYDNGSNKRMIFHDGISWKYVHDNSAV